MLHSRSVDTIYLAKLKLYTTGQQPHVPPSPSPWQATSSTLCVYELSYFGFHREWDPPSTSPAELADFTEHSEPWLCSFLRN